MSLSNIKHIVLILSGKGGVGKSSITTQLALSLSLSGHSVGILDLDLTGPSIPRLFNLESAKITQAPGGWLPVQVHQSQILPPIPHDDVSSEPNGSVPNANAQNGASLNGTANGAAPQSIDALTSNQPTEIPIGALHIISLALLLPSRSSAIIWRGPKKTAMVRQFLTDTLWPSLDYLLIDTPPGTSDEHISLVETLLLQTSPTTGTEKAHLAGAVIVTTPQAISISDVKKEINFCRKVGVGILGVVENMSGYVCECCGAATNLFSKGGGEVMSREFGVGFLGSVPVDRQWGVLVEEGRRPRYGKVVKKGDKVGGEDDDVDEEEEDEEAEMDVEGSGGAEREAGLLADKYRSCSLCPVFEGITRQMVEIVEAGG